MAASREEQRTQRCFDRMIHRKTFLARNLVGQFNDDSSAYAATRAGGQPTEWFTLLWRFEGDSVTHHSVNEGAQRIMSHRIIQDGL